MAPWVAGRGQGVPSARQRLIRHEYADAPSWRAADSPPTRRHPLATPFSPAAALDGPRVNSAPWPLSAYVPRRSERCCGTGPAEESPRSAIGTVLAHGSGWSGTARAAPAETEAVDSWVCERPYPLGGQKRGPEPRDPRSRGRSRPKPSGHRRGRAEATRTPRGWAPAKGSGVARDTELDRSARTPQKTIMLGRPGRRGAPRPAIVVPPTAEVSQ